MVLTTLGALLQDVPVYAIMIKTSKCTQGFTAYKESVNSFKYFEVLVLGVYKYEVSGWVIN